MMSSKNNSFTANDIERYHSGKMSAEERHSLEKAALDDPFLAEALEGYALTSNPSNDLAKIQSRLDEKLGRKKVIPLFQKYKWLSVAAIVLIMAAVGWLVFSISGKENESVAVVKKENQLSNDSVQYLTHHENLNDSLSIASGLTIQHLPKGTQSQTTLPETNNSAVAARPQRQLSKKKESMEGNEVTEPVVIQPTAQNEISTNKSFFKAETKDAAKNNALAAEPKANNVIAPYVNKETLSNNAPLSSRTRTVNTNDTIKDLNVVLQPLPADSLALQEVVIGYGTQKKSTSKYPHVTLGHYPHITIDTLEPSDGYENFDDYVTNNLKMPEEFKSKSVSGEVQLSFDVDEKGQATNIAVVKSLCKKCDEEAIRLLKEGPKWEKKKNKKGKITLKF